MPAQRANSTRRSARPARPPRPAGGARPPDVPGERGERVASALDAFRRVIRALRVSARQVEEASALRPAQLFVLGQIAAAPGQSISDLAERTLTDRSSVASMVDRLAGRGLVTRRRGADDRRRVEVALTAAGRRVLARAPSSPTEHLLAAIERLDDATVDQLAHALGALVGAMGVGDGRTTMLFEDAAPDAQLEAAFRRLAEVPLGW